MIPGYRLYDTDMGSSPGGQPNFALTDDEYAADVRTGCLGISIQRGDAEWLDEKYDPSAAESVVHRADNWRSVKPSQSATSRAHSSVHLASWARSCSSNSAL